MYRALLSLFAIAALFHLNADEEEVSTVEEAEVCSEECDPCCPSRRFQARVDFLYWQATEDGLEYGTKMVATPIIGVSSTSNTKLLDLHFEWDPGFRVGLGYIMNDFDAWSFNVNWTHIHNHAHGKANALGIEGQVTDVNTIIPTWVNLLFELRAGANSASAHWHLDYDVLDVVLCKSLCLSDRLLFNPYFGLQGAWIDQDYKARYNTVFLLAADAPTFTRVVTFKGDTDFKAGGLRGGFDIVCRLTDHWHLFSGLSTNLLYGQFDVKMKNLNGQSLGEGEVPPSPLNFTVSENFKRLRLHFEEVIGFGWERFFRSERYRLGFQAAFEMSQWLNQNQLFTTFYFRGQDTISSFPVRNQGDLSFIGARLSAQFDF